MSVPPALISLSQQDLSSAEIQEELHEHYNDIEDLISGVAENQFHLIINGSPGMGKTEFTKDILREYVKGKDNKDPIPRPSFLSGTASGIKMFIELQKITSIILILFLSLLSSPSWSESLVCKYTGFNCSEIDDFGELVKLEGIFYKKFTETPFTGKVIGRLVQGSIKDGKKEGEWVYYYNNGQIQWKTNYKDGKEQDGLWEGYYYDGQLEKKGNIKDGKEDGLWEYYWENSRLKKKGYFKDGKPDGFWEYYYEHGQLERKGNYKDGKKYGLWEYFNKDGSLEKTETWKDGVKQ